MKKWLIMSLLASLTFGCGGGGGDDGVSAQAAGTAVTATTPTNTTSSPIVPIVPGQAQTFSFPAFSVDSRLVIIPNFQTTTATSNESGTLTAELGTAAGALPREILNRYDPSVPTEDASPCGFADVSMLSSVMEEDEVREQSISTVRPRFQELPEGARRDFYLVPAFKSVTGEKVLEPSETEHCTIFAEVIDDQPVVDRTKAMIVAQAFDSNNPQRPGSGIYDQVRAVFGSEWNQNPPGGNDGDQKVVIFFFSPKTLGQGLFGYVSPADGNPDGGTNSNRGEIIYVNAGKSTYQTLATISHEFQHVINQNEKVNQQGLNPDGAQQENVSINEGLSGLAEEVCGYTFESGNDLLVLVTNNYLEKPEQHEFFDFLAAGLGYGQGYLFFRYVREHFGDSTVRALSTDPDTGIANLNEHLPVGFAETFRRWTIANYATNLGGNVPGIYKYPSGLRTDGTYPAGTLVGVKTFPMSNNTSNRSPALGPWSTAYMVLDDKPGSGVTAKITPAGNSAYGVIFEQQEGQFTTFED